MTKAEKIREFRREVDGLLVKMETMLADVRGCQHTDDNIMRCEIHLSDVFDSLRGARRCLEG